MLERGLRAGRGRRAAGLRARPPDRVRGGDVALGVGPQRPRGGARGDDRRGARRRAPARDRASWSRAAWRRSSRGVDGAIAAAPVTDTVKEADPTGVCCARSTARVLWADPDAAGVPRGGPAPGARRRRRRLAAATDDAALVEAAGGTGARGRGAPGEHQGDHARPTCAWPRRCAVLTDYHVHLRPDEDGPTASASSPRRTPTATARPPRSAASRSSASPSTSTASCSRSRSGRTPGTATGRRTTSTSTASSCASAGLSVGHRGGLPAGARGPRRRTCSTGREWDYVVGSDPLPRATRRSTCTASRTGRVGHLALGRPREGLGALLRDARRGCPHGHVRHPRPPRPREGLGRPRAGAGGRPAPLLRARDGRDRGLGRGDRGLHRRAAQAGRRDLSGPGVPGDVPRGRAAGGAVERRPPARAARLRVRAGARAARAISACARSPSSRAASGGWSRSDEPRAHRHRLRLAPPRGGPAARARRGRDPRRRARPRRPLGRRRARRTRSWTPCSAPPRSATSATTSRTRDERWRERGLDRPARRGARARAPRPDSRR